MRRPQLRSYLMLPESFVGGTFPQEIADLMREIEALESEYLEGEASAADPAPVTDTHRALEQFAKETAELYELMAASSSSVQAMRDGLEISDDSVLARYNRGVDEVNAAHEELDAAIKALTAEQQVTFRRMNVASVIKK